MHHFRKTMRLYRKNLRQTGCPFCNKNVTSTHVEDLSNFFIIPNKPSYDVWELHRVAEHLLLIPKRHIEQISDFTDTERTQMAKTIARYEAKGYSIYARGVKSPRRSVPHQHTHLIKIDGPQARFSIFLKKPYLLFLRQG